VTHLVVDLMRKLSSLLQDITILCTYRAIQWLCSKTSANSSAHTISFVVRYSTIFPTQATLNAEFICARNESAQIRHVCANILLCALTRLRAALVISVTCKPWLLHYSSSPCAMAQLTERCTPNTPPNRIYSINRLVGLLS